MKARFILLAFFTLLSFLVNEGESFLLQSTIKNMDCRKMMLKMTKRHLKLFNNCTREIESNTKGDEEEFKKQLGCIIKCTLSKNELLDENGKLTEVLLQGWLERFIPKEMHEIGHQMVSGCVEEYVPLMDNTDKYCTKGYIGYVNCIGSLMADIC